MTIAITIAICSIVGIVILYARQIPIVSSMTLEEIAGVLQRERPLLTQAWKKIVRGVRTLWHRYFRTKILTYLVKKVFRLRILIMRMEQALFRVASRLRARSLPAIPTSPSDYWRDMHKWRKTVHWHKKEK